jgi:hypothetical protein
MKIEITEVSEVGYLPRLELRADGKFINSFSYTLDRDGQRRAEKLAEAMRLADEIMEKGNTQPITKLVYRYEDKIVYQEDGNYPLPAEYQEEDGNYPLPAEVITTPKEKEITMVISDPTRLEYFLKAAKIYLRHEPKYRELSIELDGVKDGYLVFLPTDFSESILCQHVFSIGITVGAISATSSLGKVEG